MLITDQCMAVNNFSSVIIYWSVLLLTTEVNQGVHSNMPNISWLSLWTALKVHSQGLLWQQIDLDICSLHTFFCQVTKFKTLRNGFYEIGLSHMGHSKNEILGETPLNMTWIEEFPCLICNFSIIVIISFLPSAPTVPIQILNNSSEQHIPT